MRSGAVVLLILFFFLPLPAHEIERVALQLQWLPQFQFAGYIMAKEKGYYAAAGLDVDIRPMRADLDVEKEVLSGRAEFGTGRSSLLIAYDRGEPVVALAAIFQSSPMVLLVRKDSGIRSVEALRGKRVMLTEDVRSAASIQAMLRGAGLTQKDLLLLAHTFDPGSLERNETDAMAAYLSNEPFILAGRGIETHAFDPKKYGFDFYSDILFTSQNEVAQHPDRTRRFYEASLKGWHYAFMHIEETAQLLYQKYNPQHKSLDALRNEGEILKRLALVDNTPLGMLSPERLHAINQAYSLLGFTGGTRDIDAFVYHPERMEISGGETAWLKAHPVIRVGVDPGWPPVEFIENNGQFSGITSGYIHRIADKLGIRVELVHYQNRSEVDQAMRRHELDVTTAMPNFPDRHSYAAFTRPFLSLPMVVVSGKSFQYVGDLAALRGKRVAVVKGYAADTLLGRDFPRITRIETENLSEALKLVAYGKADAAVGALAAVSYLIASEELSNLRVVGQTPYRYEVAMGVRKDWPELLRLMQKALDSISGQEREAIYHEWVPTVYEHRIDFALLWKILALTAVAALLFGYRYIRLEELVRRRTRELEELNATLHDRIAQAVEENRRKERMMIQQAKMATIGEMIESIAHQWRQPLNIMGIGISNLELKRQLGTLEPEELDRLIDMVQRQVAYMSQTIDDFRNFFKKDKQIVHVRLRELVDEVVALVAPALQQQKIDLHITVPDLLSSDLYPNELKQVILNLLSNAKDAVLLQGRPDKRIEIKAYESAEIIHLEISDNGGGVPDAIMDKIFEPYFTTKFEAQGTGIGLYMSKIIVEKNLRGTIAVMNGEAGACFSIVWPKKLGQAGAEA